MIVLDGCDPIRLGESLEGEFSRNSFFGTCGGLKMDVCQSTCLINEYGGCLVPMLGGLATKLRNQTWRC
jgi:hypothetical protein